MSGESKFSLEEFGECFCDYCKDFLNYNECKCTCDKKIATFRFDYQYYIQFSHQLKKISGVLITFLFSKYNIKEIVRIDGTDNQFSIVVDEQTNFRVVIELHISDCSEYIANSLSEYLDIVKDLSEQSKGECFYRGEPKNYRGECCNPSLFRRKIQDYEKKLIYGALTKAPYEFEGLTSLDILAKMQHYGVPTRLLDVTANPLVALFFSIFTEKSLSYDFDGCVYFFSNGEESRCLTFDSDKALLLSNLCKLTDEQKKTIYKYAASKSAELVTPEKLDEFKTKHLDDLWEAFTKLIYESERERTALLQNHRIVPTDLLKNYFIKPKYSNELRAQSGLFIIFGLGGGKVYIDPKDCKSPYDIKATRIIIPAHAKEDILDELKNKADINEYTMYPEFEHLAKCLSNCNK